MAPEDDVTELEKIWWSQGKNDSDKKPNLQEEKKHGFLR